MQGISDVVHTTPAVYSPSEGDIIGLIVILTSGLGASTFSYGTTTLSSTDQGSSEASYVIPFTSSDAFWQLIAINTGIPLTITDTYATGTITPSSGGSVEIIELTPIYADWTATNKNTAPWTPTTKTLSGNSFLLLENGFYLLLEDGSSKLILEQSNPGPIAWTAVNKS